MPLTYLGLGTNLGNLSENLDNAIQQLELNAGNIIRISSYISSEPQEFESTNQFLNAVVLLHTELTPLALLKVTQQIELQLGRTQKSTNGYLDRIIDIDILLYDRQLVDLPELKIPHPKMTERDFVLLPLAEIAPDLTHPANSIPFTYIK